MIQDRLLAGPKSASRRSPLDLRQARFWIASGLPTNRELHDSQFTPHLEAILRQEALAPVIVDTSEFEQSGGSLFWMKAFLP
jgi:hypothetical protein